MIAIKPAQGVLSEQVLLDKYGEKLSAMIRENLEQDMEAERLTQTLMALTHVQNWRGKQYTVPKFDKYDGSITVESAKDSSGREMFSSVYNIIKSDGRKFIGAVSSRAPNAKCIPDDDEAEDDVSRSEQADAHLRDLRRKWDVDQRQGELGEIAWVTGPAFGYTPYVADGHKYGFTEEPIIGVTEQPLNAFGDTMPVPQVTGTKKYPNGDVELHIYDVLYVTIPYGAKSLEECPYLCCEEMERKALLKARYGKKLKDKAHYDEGGSGTRQQQLEAQQQSVAPSGTAQDAWQKDRWRHSRWWVRPSLYALIEGVVELSEDEVARNEDGDPISVADQLLEQFPDGLKITMVNGIPVDVTHERMEEVWAACKVAGGGPIIQEPLCSDLIPIQRDVNNFFNMAKEIILRHVVKTAINAQAFDRNALVENDAIINELVPVETGPGQSIKDLFAAFPTASMPDGLERIVQAMLSLRREIGGVTEALFGGGQPANTYRAEKQRRDQSMMQFSPFYGQTQRFWEKAYSNAIKQRAKYGSGRIKVPGENGEGSLVVDTALLAEGGWHVECEEGIPMTFAEETDRAIWMMAESGDPTMPATMGLVEQLPSTHFGTVTIPTPKFKRMLGIQGVRPQGEVERDRVVEIINRLLKEPPIEDVDPMTGVPITRPAIEPEDFVDDHLLVAQLVREWCKSKPGRRQKETNPDGYAHVVAYGKAQQERADALAAPPMPPEGEEPPPLPQGEEPMPEGPPAPQGDTFDTEPPPM